MCLLRVGLNNWRYAVPLIIKEGNIDQPIAISCRLGWTVYSTKINNESTNIDHLFLHRQLEEIDCDQEKQKMPKENLLEVNVPRYDMASKEQQQENELMKSTTTSIGNRFQTGLLSKYDDLKLPDKHPMALRRLSLLEKHLERDKNLMFLKGKEKPTKREIQRMMMSIYDPLGPPAPFISYFKVCMQEILLSKRWLTGSRKSKQSVRRTNPCFVYMQTSEMKICQHDYIFLRTRVKIIALPSLIYA